MRNFVYISRTKVEVYHPQLPSSYRSEASGKVSLKLLAVNAELARKQSPEDSDVGRMLQIVDYLRTQGEIGTIAEPKGWFEGVLELGSIIDGPRILFGTTLHENGKSTAICLTASTRHMVGAEYDSAASSNVAMKDVGSTRSTVFSINSNNVAFAEALATAEFVARETAEKAPVAPSSDSHRASQRDDDDVSRGSLILETLRRWKAGLFPSKRNALSKRGPAYRARNRLMDSEVAFLRRLRAVAGGCSHQPRQTYEFVATNLLCAEVDGDRVLLGSPLYLALEPRHSR